MSRTNQDRILEAEAALVFLNVGSEVAAGPIRGTAQIILVHGPTVQEETEALNDGNPVTLYQATWRKLDRYARSVLEKNAS
jgi:hypothetical protein